MTDRAYGYHKLGSFEQKKMHREVQGKRQDVKLDIIPTKAGR